MPASPVGPHGAYDLILQDIQSSPATTVGLVLDRDELGRPRIIERRIEPIPPRQSSGAIEWTHTDPLVDFVWAMDDWSGGALQPFYRSGGNKYASATGIDARWKGVLALGMNSVGVRGIIFDGTFESADVSGWSVLTGSGTAVSASTDTPRTGSYNLLVNSTSTGSAEITAEYPLTNPTAYQGRAVIFAGWSRGSPNSRIGIRDSAGVTWSSATAVGTFAFLSASRTIDAAATFVRLVLSSNWTAPSTVASGYLDDAFFGDTTSTAVGIVEAAGSLYAAFGPYILRWNETGDFWEGVYVQVVGTQATHIASYKDQVYVAYGTAVAYVYGTGTAWTVASGGSGNDARAQFFVVQRNRLWKSETANTLRYSTSDLATVTSWGTTYTVGEVSAPITGLYMLNDAVVVGTERGIHIWFEDELLFRNVTNHYESDPNTGNFARGIVRGSWLYMTTAKQGLIRFDGRTIEDLSPLFMAPRLTSFGGRVTALAQDQHQLWLLVDVPTADSSTTKTTRLMSLREEDGHLQLHTLSNVSLGDANFLAVAGNYLYAMGRLAINSASNYFPSNQRWTLPQKSAAPYQDTSADRDLVSSGTLDLPTWHGGVPDQQKALVKVVVWVADTNSTETIILTFGVNGAANTTTTAATINTSTSVQTFYATSIASYSTVAIGRFWDWRIAFARGTTVSNSPKLFAIAFHYVMRPPRVKSWECFIRIGGNTRKGVPDGISKTTILSNLSTLEQQVYPASMRLDLDQNDADDAGDITTLPLVTIRQFERVVEEKERVREGTRGPTGELYRLVLQEVV